jgi:hypothetical protein
MPNLTFSRSKWLCEGALGAAGWTGARVRRRTWPRRPNARSASASGPKRAVIPSMTPSCSRSCARRPYMKAWPRCATCMQCLRIGVVRVALYHDGPTPLPRPACLMHSRTPTCSARRCTCSLAACMLLDLRDLRAQAGTHGDIHLSKPEGTYVLLLALACAALDGFFSPASWHLGQAIPSEGGACNMPQAARAHARMCTPAARHSSSCTAR